MGINTSDELKYRQKREEEKKSNNEFQIKGNDITGSTD